jgi:hypothetical protein
MQEFWAKNKMEVVPQTPPPNFFLFPKLKIELKG